MFRNTSQIVQPLCFFIIIALLFPLSLPVENNLLVRIGGGVIWVAAVLSVMLGIGTLFQSDYDDGSLEQWLIKPRSLPLAMLGKVAGHWSATGLLLCLFSPVLSITFGLQEQEIKVLFISLLLGTPSLSLIGAIGAALTVTLHRGGVLLAIIIMPLFIPIIIFGAGMVNSIAIGNNTESQIYSLMAILALSLTLAPFAIAGALKATVK